MTLFKQSESSTKLPTESGLYYKQDFSLNRGFTETFSIKLHTRIGTHPNWHNPTSTSRQRQQLSWGINLFKFGDLDSLPTITHQIYGYLAPTWPSPADLPSANQNHAPSYRSAGIESAPGHKAP